MKPPIEILLLDDDLMSNLINEKIFQITGYDVKVNSFTDAKAALKHLYDLVKFEIDFFPDVIFVDINMTGMNGWEFIDKLLALPETVLTKAHLYILTSSIDEEDINKSNSYSIIKGMHSKPLTEEIVVQSISKIIFRN